MSETVAEYIEGWFPISTDNAPGWRLDIVSLLAVIGEDSLKEHSQPMTASWFGCLPRIMPAPQVLLKAVRPLRMPQVPATVVGVESGVSFATLNYFPNILHPIEDLPPLAFKYIEITHNKEKNKLRLASSDKRENSRIATGKAAEHQSPENGSSTSAVDLEVQYGKPIKRKTVMSMHSVKEVFSNFETKLPPHVPAKTFSPLNIISILSCALTCGLFVQSATQHDGVACVALGVISLASFILGYASWWKPILMRVYNDPDKLPPGDIVIRTREGAFIVVKCTEEVARELYSGTEECKYVVKSARLYRGLVGIGTFLVMVSVVLLGNCNFLQQATIGGSYILLNGLYWLASLVPKRHFWDLSLYNVKTISEDIPQESDVELAANMSKEDRPSFTRTMWLAIKATEKVGWVKKSNAAPETDEWDKWLLQAQNEVNQWKIEVNDWEKLPDKDGLPKPTLTWPAVQAKDNIVGKTDRGEAGSAQVHGISVPGAQEAPAQRAPLENSK